MAYPLFQSAISSSTPFPGTYAETASPTPAGSKEQQPQESAYEAPTQEDIQRDQASYEANQKRELDHLSVQRAQLLRQRMMVQNMKWSKHPESSRWVRRQALGLNGNKDVEPPEMMYKRMQHIDRMTDQVKAIDEQIRLTSQLSPFTSARLAEAGKDEANQLDINVQLSRWNKVNEALPDDMKLPPDTILALAQNPTASTSGRYGENDPIKALTAPAEAGYKYGKGIIDLLPKSGQPAGAVGANRADEDNARKASEKSKADKPTYTAYQLFNMAGMAYRQILAAIPKTGDEEYMTTNLVGDPVKQTRKVHNEDDMKKARVQVQMMMPPEFMEAFPTYVKEGEGAPPTIDALKAGDQGQKDVTAFEKEMADRKAKRDKAK